MQVAMNESGASLLYGHVTLRSEYVNLAIAQVCRFDQKIKSIKCVTRHACVMCDSSHICDRLRMQGCEGKGRIYEDKILHIQTWVLSSSSTARWSTAIGWTSTSRTLRTQTRQDLVTYLLVIWKFKPNCYLEIQTAILLAVQVEDLELVRMVIFEG